VNEDVTQDHYARLAARYDENWAHSPAYLEWMTEGIREQLHLTGAELVADIGCGTGLYSRRLAPFSAVRERGGVRRTVRGDARPGPAR